MEKYANHPDSERIIAREMGWSWLERRSMKDEEKKAKPKERNRGLGSEGGPGKRESEEDMNYELPPPDRCVKELIGSARARPHFAPHRENAPMNALQGLLDE